MEPFEFDTDNELDPMDYIVQHDNISFQIPSRPITKKDMEKSEFMDDLSALFEVWTVFELTALTLPQVGSNKKGFLFSEYYTTMDPNAKAGVEIALNPRIVSKSEGVHISIETCPSVNAGTTAYLVKRYDKIIVEFQTLKEKAPKTMELTGIKADSFQYAMDLLDGIFICDSGKPIHITDEEIKAFKEEIKGFEGDKEQNN